jgi:hypothetical protein
MLQTIWIFAISSVGWSTRRLHVSTVPRLRADGTQKGCGVKSAGPDFHIERLHDDATALRPKTFKSEDEPLKSCDIFDFPSQRLPPVTYRE